MDLTGLLQGNPLIQKFGRSRLRAEPTWASVIVVLIVCACVLWAALPFPNQDRTTHLVVLLVLQVILVSVLGSAEVAASLAQARDSGALDFHRISPQRPLAIAAGFILGAPVREWILAACTVPVFMFCAGRTAAGYAGGLTILLMVAVSALFHHCLAALAGIVTARARNAAANAVGLVVLLHIAGPWALGVFTCVPTATELLTPPKAQEVLHQLTPAGSFMGLALPAVVLSLLHQLPALLFGLIALVRRIHLDVATPFSRPQALAAQLVFSFLVVADVWSVRYVSDGVPSLSALATLGGSVLLAMLLAAPLTPGTGQIARGVRHNLKLGRSGISPLDDRAPNLGLVLALAGLVLVAGLAVTLTHTPEPSEFEVADWGLAGQLLPPLLAALLVIHFGAAYQFFAIRSGRHGPTLAGLYLFLAWLLPLPLAGLVAISLGSGAAAEWIPATIASLSHPAVTGMCGLIPVDADMSGWGFLPGMLLNVLLTGLWVVLSISSSARAVEIARLEPTAQVPSAPPPVPPPPAQGAPS